MAAPLPASKPAIAALAINIFLDFVMILLPSSVILLLTYFGPDTSRRPQAIRRVKHFSPCGAKCCGDPGQCRSIAPKRFGLNKSRTRPQGYRRGENRKDSAREAGGAEAFWALRACLLSASTGRSACLDT